VLSVGKADPIVNISLNGTALPYVSSCRDLGVTITSDLSPSTIVVINVRKKIKNVNKRVFYEKK